MYDVVDESKFLMNLSSSPFPLGEYLRSGYRDQISPVLIFYTILSLPNVLVATIAVILLASSSSM